MAPWQAVLVGAAWMMFGGCGSAPLPGEPGGESDNAIRDVNELFDSFSIDREHDPLSGARERTVTVRGVIAEREVPFDCVAAPCVNPSPEFYPVLVDVSGKGSSRYLSYEIRFTRDAALLGGLQADEMYVLRGVLHIAYDYRIGRRLDLVLEPLEIVSEG